jgi:hypothetical protein
VSGLVRFQSDVLGDLEGASLSAVVASLDKFPNFDGLEVSVVVALLSLMCFFSRRKSSPWKTAPMLK